MLKYWAGVDGRWVGAARGSLVNNRWVGSGYGRWHGRWVGGSVELSVTVVACSMQFHQHTQMSFSHQATKLPHNEHEHNYIRDEHFEFSCILTI